VLYYLLLSRDRIIAFCNLPSFSRLSHHVKTLALLSLRDPTIYEEAQAFLASSFTMIVLCTAVLLLSYVRAETNDDEENILTKDTLSFDWCSSWKMQDFEYCPAAAEHNEDSTRSIIVYTYPDGNNFDI
ncbi:hypothetical protein PFISCL1PPCAC_11949, partial [Pristionchus fissidentatus]